MKITFGGVRGSQPVAGPEFVEFGGHTTSFLIASSEGKALIVDAGSGAPSLAATLGTDIGALQILLTHYHLDHVMGLSAIPQMYVEGCHVEITGPEMAGHTPPTVIPSVMNSPLWPFTIESYPAQIEFSVLPEVEDKDGVLCQGLRLRRCLLHHHEGCMAYRFDEEATGRSLVLATDVEWQASTKEEKEAFLHLCTTPSSPDLLVFDAHCTPDDYEQLMGWGHSTWRDAVEVAKAVGATRLLTTHHAPESVDATLHSVERQIQQALSTAAIARQGMVVEV